VSDLPWKEAIASFHGRSDTPNSDRKENKKKEPASHPSVKGQRDSWKSGKRKRKEKKRKKKSGRKTEERKKAPYSLPSLCERSETPGALERHDWESQETPVAQNRPFGFGPH